MENMIVIVLAGLAAAYSVYVQLIKKRNDCLEALAGIDVQFNLRFDLIPNILKIAKKYMEHERQLLTEVTKLRSEVKSAYNKSNPQDVNDHLKMIETLSSKMGQLMISVEAYPDLKSDKTMIQAMQTYNEVEANIAAARRFYNSSVKALNNMVEIFPMSIVAKMISVKAMPFFEATEGARAPINADDYLN